MDTAKNIFTHHRLSFRQNNHILLNSSTLCWPKQNLLLS